MIYSVGWELGKREKAAIAAVPAGAWQIAVDERGEARERRTEDACGDPGCAHRRCWIEEAHVTELTGLLRESPAGDQLDGWPEKMRLFARRERPHPGRPAVAVRDRRRLAIQPVGHQPARTHDRLARPTGLH